MRLISVVIENFRCYQNPVTVRFGDLTALVGRNDVGKSSIMDALAIFFDAAAPDKDDASKLGNPKEMRITCEFDQFPAQLVVDTDFPTSLTMQHLLSSRDTLILRKTYNGSLATPKLSAIEAIARHPRAAGYND